MNEVREIMNRGQVPKHLLKARLVPLSKVKGSSNAAIQDIRPIMIKSNIYKIMEKTILQKIKDSKSNLLKSKKY